MATTAWRTGGASVRGASHERTGRVNQDALGVADGERAAIAVADGHGSARCFRSDVGSAAAVAAALSQLTAYAGELRGAADSRDVLAARIVEDWTARVRAHRDAHPLEPGERARAGDAELLPYGTTLIAAVADGDEVLAVQIGDGDLLVHDGVPHRVFPRDPRFVLNTTTSLCLPDARDEVRVARFAAPPGTLVLAATDGYANSYASDAEFVQIADRYRAAIAADGFVGTLAQLPPLLESTMRAGSGDDITLALLFRDD